MQLAHLAGLFWTVLSVSVLDNTPFFLLHLKSHFHLNCKHYTSFVTVKLMFIDLKLELHENLELILMFFPKILLYYLSSETDL